MYNGRLLDIITDDSESSNNNTMKAFTNILNHKYMKVNYNIENIEFDDTSIETYNKLIYIADQWFETCGDQVIEFITS